MESRKFMIAMIPAVRYGKTSDRCFLYIRGKMGFKEEAESFAEIVCTKGWQVLSIDLPEHGERIQEKDRFNPWFAMQSFDGPVFERSSFVSPVLDMEKLIQNMIL